MLLRDHLEQLLCTLLRAMPRADVELLLADRGSHELVEFGREAVAATVVTALLRDSDGWPGAREVIRRGSRRGHKRSCDPAARDEAAALTEALLSRLDFGLGMHRRRRGSLDTALEESRGGGAPTEPQAGSSTPGR